MSFGELLNQYINQIGCNAQELARLSGLSPAVLSRYRSGARTPLPESEAVDKLSRALSMLSEQGEPQSSIPDIASKLNAAIREKNAKDFNADIIVRNLNALINILEIKISHLAKHINYDASFISRIRAGQRMPSDLGAFALAISKYVAKNYDSDTGKAIIEELTGCEELELMDERSFQRTVAQWLSSGHAPKNDIAAHFLGKLDEFDLDEYIRAIHFNEMKVPTVPFQLPASKNYFGLNEMMESELNFLKATVLSKSTESVITYSDMPIEEMSRDPEFPKKWMFGTAMMLKKGLHLSHIHNIDRPFEEMMLGIESWIPMYMTGQISPYYLKHAQNSVFHHFLNVSGAAALSGEAIVGAHAKGKYYLTKKRDEVAYYRKRAERLLSKALPLMEVYRLDSIHSYKAFLVSNSKSAGKRHNILPSPPLYTMSEELLTRILKRNNISAKDCENILYYANEQRDQMEAILEQDMVLDEIAELTREEFDRFPFSVLLSDIFYEHTIRYSYEEYLEHLILTRKFAQVHANYTFKTSSHQAFRNIAIKIHEGKCVTVSKNKHPMIHFVIRHPKMCHAIENMVIPVVEE